MDSYQKKDKNAAVKKLCLLYAKMHGQGAEFFVDGTPVKWGEAALTAVAEESIYMADYVVGEDGHIAQVRLDRIEP